MKTQVYNLEGKEVSEIELPDVIFGRAWNADLVQQLIVSQMANARHPWAHAKGRAEVSGGGKKPWKQKHTGRARHGSIRSPIWKGGGVSHGPVKMRSYTVKVNKKMLSAGLAVVLSRRLKDGELRIVDSLPAETKTKALVGALKASTPRLNALLVPAIGNKNIFKASSNISNLKALAPNSLNIYDAMRYKRILIDKDAVALIGKNRV